jgi:hypothetical protein
MSAVRGFNVDDACCSSCCSCSVDSEAFTPQRLAGACRRCQNEAAWKRVRPGIYRAGSTSVCFGVSSKETSSKKKTHRVRSIFLVRKVLLLHIWIVALTDSWVQGGVGLFPWLPSPVVVTNLTSFPFFYLLVMAFCGSTTYSSSSPVVAVMLRFMRDMAC